MFDLAEYGIEDGIVGILSIPKMDLELPIYLGATAEHLAGGAAQLSQTSMPIGGENTNCVLAGHQGWYGALFFRLWVFYNASGRRYAARLALDALRHGCYYPEDEHIGIVVSASMASRCFMFMYFLQPHWVPAT